MENNKGWGGSRKGAGRKTGTTLNGDGVYRSARIMVTCTEEEASKIKALAKANGKSASRFIVDLALNQH